MLSRAQKKLALEVLSDRAVGLGVLSKEVFDSFKYRSHTHRVGMYVYNKVGEIELGKYQPQSAIENFLTALWKKGAITRRIKAGGKALWTIEEQNNETFHLCLMEFSSASQQEGECHCNCAWCDNGSHCYNRRRGCNL